jgi:hypothetical protein
MEAALDLDAPFRLPAAPGEADLIAKYFVTTLREHRTVFYPLADERVAAVVELARALLHENAEHVAACPPPDGGCSEIFSKASTMASRPDGA